MTRTFAAIAAAVALTFLGGTLAALRFSAADEDPFGPCRASQVAGGTATIGGPFRLTDQTGREVTEAEVLRNPSLVYFGYTFCPDVCPFDVARNVAAVEELAARGLAVTPVFVSVDPDRDTPQALSDWVAAFHPAMIALTGSPEAIGQAARAYKVYYNVPPHDGIDAFYPVDHTTLTYLMLPGHGFAELYRRDASPEQMADSVACFLGAAPAPA